MQSLCECLHGPDVHYMGQTCISRECDCTKYTPKSIETENPPVYNNKVDWEEISDFFRKLTENYSNAEDLEVIVHVPENKTQLSVRVPRKNREAFMKALPLYGAKVECYE